MSEIVSNLRNDKDFLDVTLACDDGWITAHKVILSANSAFFRDILTIHSHQHPLIYLRGIKYSVLNYILDFMYRGEVSVKQEDLDEFITIANELKVNGLTQASCDNENGSKENSSSISTENPTKSDSVMTVESALMVPSEVDSGVSAHDKEKGVSNADKDGAKHDDILEDDLKLSDSDADSFEEHLLEIVQEGLDDNRNILTEAIKIIICTKCDKMHIKKKGINLVKKTY